MSLKVLLKERQEDGLVLDSPGLVHPLKVDADASVVDNVPVHVALRPEKIMLCEEPLRQMVVTSRWGR